VCRTVHMLALTSDIELIHMLERIPNSGTRHELTVPGSEMRELLLDIEVAGKEMSDRIIVVLDEGKIGDGALVANEPDIWHQQNIGRHEEDYGPFLLAQNVVQDTKNTLDLALEPTSLSAVALETNE
jgi:hypothetical protein